MTDAFDAHAHSFSRKQKIRSLKFCETEITAAADRYRRALRADGPSDRGLRAAMEGLAARLASQPPAPEIAEAVIEARGRLLEIAESLDAKKSLDVEKSLARVEDRLAESASSALGPDALAVIEKATRDATAAYKSRMPAKVYETLIAESVRRKILQRFSLPRFLLAEIE